MVLHRLVELAPFIGTWPRPEEPVSDNPVSQDGDRGGLAESEQTHGKKKEKVCLDINRPSHGRTWPVHVVSMGPALVVNSLSPGVIVLASIGWMFREF